MLIANYKLFMYKGKYVGNNHNNAYRYLNYIIIDYDIYAMFPYTPYMVCK